MRLRGAGSTPESCKYDVFEERELISLKQKMELHTGAEN